MNNISPIQILQQEKKVLVMQLQLTKARLSGLLEVFGEQDYPQVSAILTTEIQEITAVLEECGI